MPKTRQMSIRFPLKGANRSTAYQETPPYFTPKSVNMCGVGPLEDRARGGTRLCLSKLVSTDFGNNISKVAPVTFLDTDGNHKSAVIVVSDGLLYLVDGSTVSLLTAELVLGADTFQIDGQDLVFPSVLSAEVETAVSITEDITIGGETLVFVESGSGITSSAERLGKLYLTGSKLQVYDPSTGVLADVANAPTLEPLVCVYRDRIILGGKNHLGYACRVSDPEDWDFGSDINDTTQPVVFQLSEAGRIGETLTAMIPFRDEALVSATQNSLWALHGDPATGTLKKVSGEVGVIAQNAWCITEDGLVAFLSNDGVYLWGVGSGAPVRFSAERVPSELREIDPDENEFGMAWDAKKRGFWLFITPNGGSPGKHWFFDMDQKAMWQMQFLNAQQPRSVAGHNSGSGLNKVLLGCRDGYLRTFSDSASSDDGSSMNSHIVLGAFRMAPSTIDGLLAEIHGSLADNASGVTWRVFTGPTAEYVTDAAVAAVDALIVGDDPVLVKASGTWGELFNRVARPRVRGAWCAIVLSSAGKWAFEGMNLVVNALGRQRQ